MRIGQLARRLGVPPTEILGFLGTQSIDAEAGANSRLSDDNVVRVINFFAPGKLPEIMAAPVVEEPVPEIVEEPVVVEQPAAVEQTAPVPDAPVEVIRVSKVELQGLKVLGKIELLEKKKVEPVVQPEGEQQQPAQRPARREYPKRNERKDHREREWKNPLEARRQQEAREAEKKKQEAAERLKEKRTNHYYNKVKSVPTKAVRRVQEEVVVEDIETKSPPKGVFGRFLRWLRT